MLLFFSIRRRHYQNEETYTTVAKVELALGIDTITLILLSFLFSSRLKPEDVDVLVLPEMAFSG